MAEEFAGLEFHSIRLEKRFVRIMETLIKQPDASIREARISYITTCAYSH